MYFILILITEDNVCTSSQSGRLRGTELSVLNTDKKPCPGSLIYINYYVAPPYFQLLFFIASAGFSGLLITLLYLLLVKDEGDKNSTWFHPLHLAKKVIRLLSLTKHWVALPPPPANPSYHLRVFPISAIDSNNTE